MIPMIPMIPTIPMIPMIPMSAFSSVRSRLIKESKKEGRKEGRPGAKKRVSLHLHKTCGAVSHCERTGDDRDGIEEIELRELKQSAELCCVALRCVVLRWKGRNDNDVRERERERGKDQTSDGTLVSDGDEPFFGRDGVETLPGLVDLNLVDSSGKGIDLHETWLVHLAQLCVGNDLIHDPLPKAPQIAIHGRELGVVGDVASENLLERFVRLIPVAFPSVRLCWPCQSRAVPGDDDGGCGGWGETGMEGTHWS